MEILLADFVAWDAFLLHYQTNILEKTKLQNNQN